MENKQNSHIEEEAAYRAEGGYSFSTPLKIRLIAYFRNNYDLDVKDEEADLFLASLAGLYGALSEAAKHAPEPEAVRGDGSARLDAEEPVDTDTKV